MQRDSLSVSVHASFRFVFLAQFLPGWYLCVGACPCQVEQRGWPIFQERSTVSVTLGASARVTAALTCALKEAWSNLRNVLAIIPPEVLFDSMSVHGFRPNSGELSLTGQAHTHSRHLVRLSAPEVEPAGIPCYGKRVRMKRGCWLFMLCSISSDKKSSSLSIDALRW